MTKTWSTAEMSSTARWTSRPVCPLLQRIRLAEVCHALLDRSPFILLSPETMGYGQVIEVDTRLKRFMKQMPAFFSLDNVDWSSLPPTDPRRSPSITVQRYTLNILLRHQLCKLHLPYLARGTVEPAFAYYVECLKSARLIIHVEHQMRQENLPFVSIRRRMNMVLRSVFLACIALVLDACLGSEPQDGYSNGEDVSDACSILQEAKDQSPLASKLLEELSIQVLAKHRATHPALKALRNQPLGKLGLDRESAPMTPQSRHGEHSENPPLFSVTQNARLLIWNNSGRHFRVEWTWTR